MSAITPPDMGWCSRSRGSSGRYGSQHRNDKPCADYNWHADIARRDSSLRCAAIRYSHAHRAASSNQWSSGRRGVPCGFCRCPARTLTRDWCPNSMSGSPLAKTGAQQLTRPQLVGGLRVRRWRWLGRNCVGFDLGPLGHPEVCAGPVNLGLTDVLSGQVDKHRDDLLKALQNALPCEALRSKVAEQWHPVALKIDQGAGLPLFLNIVPTAIGFSGTIASQTR